MQLGMDVARLNFSHGTHAEQSGESTFAAPPAVKRTPFFLQDLQGPKIRTGRLKGGEAVIIESGARLTITPSPVAGTASLISTDFPGLAREVEPGARILLSDGRIELKVIAIRGADVECEVLNGGPLAEQQGINLPGAAISIPALTDKDKTDLKFGLQQGRTLLRLFCAPPTIRVAEELMRKYGKSVPIVAKLEKPPSSGWKKF
jgi:pyruvate kinase